MARYLGLRMLAAVPTVLGVVTLVFSLIHVMPGDPVDVMLGETARPADRAKLRSDLGLERPLAEQYRIFVTNLVHGNLGSSIHTGKPVSELVRNRFPATLELTLAASN
jgi:peptide/nickel transport system permease protein